jgi:hypothetical protein
MRFFNALALLVMSLFIYGCGPSIDELNAQVKNLVQEDFDSSGVLKAYGLKVNTVLLSPVQENKYNGKVLVDFKGQEHNLNVSVTVGSGYPKWEFSPNAFAFVAPSDVIAFKEGVCRKGARIVYEDNASIKCRRIDGALQTTLDYDESGYRSITLTLDLKNKYMKSDNKMNAAIVIDDYIEELKKSLTLLGKSPETSEHFRSLPLSPDWNKATLIGGVDFNVPDKKGIERYSNYMLTITK